MTIRKNFPVANSMTPRRRLLNTLNRQLVDRPPFICPGGMMTMAVTEVMEETGHFWPEAHRDAETMAALTLASNGITGVENVGVPFCMTVEAEAMGARVDLGSKHMEPRITDYAIDSLADWPDLHPLLPDQGRAAICVDAVGMLKRQAPHLPVIANLTGPVSLAGSLLDPLELYKSFIKNRETAGAFLDFCGENLIKFGEAMIAAGADMICIADPSATGELIGSALFREFALPCLNRMTDAFHEKEIPVIVHICGNVKTLGQALSELTADVISIDSAVSISTLKTLAGNRLTMGNVSTFMLEKGTEASIFKAGRSRIAKGVDILAPACGISPRTSISHIKSLASAASGDKRADFAGMPELNG